MGTASSRASAEPDLYKRASAYRMHGERVDGDDLEAVHRGARRLLDARASEREPAVLEAITYRYRGHSVADAGLAYRTRRRSGAPAARPAAAHARALRERGATTDELARDRRARRSRVRGRRVRRRQPGARRRRARAGVLRAGQRRAVRPHAAGQPVRRGGARPSTRGWAMSGTQRADAAAPARERMTYREALRLALREELARDERVFIMGEEVGVFEGSYKVTAGLMASSAPTACATRRSPRRASSAPGRRGDAGRAPGRRDHDDQLPAVAMDQVDQPRGEDRRDVRRRGRCPLVIRTPNGAGNQLTAQHSQSVRRLVRRHAGPEGRDAGQPGRREGPAEGGDPRRRTRCW
jgi:hypothetical protein